MVVAALLVLVLVLGRVVVVARVNVLLRRSKRKRKGGRKRRSRRKGRTGPVSPRYLFLEQTKDQVALGSMRTSHGAWVHEDRTNGRGGVVRLLGDVGGGRRRGSLCDHVEGRGGMGEVHTVRVVWGRHGVKLRGRTVRERRLRRAKT